MPGSADGGTLFYEYKKMSILPTPIREGSKINKLKWFTHDNDASEDQWMQELIRKFGMAGYGRWWVLMENFDRHGSGDTWVTNMAFVREKLRSRSGEVGKLLDFCQTSSKVLWKEVDEKLIIDIPKLRKRRSKLKSKVLSKFLQSSSKVPLEGEVEREGDIYIAKDQKSEPETKESSPWEESFKEFWAVYPNRKAKAVALKSWLKLKPDRPLVEKIIKALSWQVKTEDWTKQDGQFVPLPSTYINQERWEDEVRKIKTVSDDLYD